MAENKFDFKKFCDDSKQTLISPADYFRSMPKTGGLTDPLIKAAIYGLVAGVILLVLGLINMGPAFAYRFGGGAGLSGLIFGVIVAIILLFIGGLIVLVLSAISGGATDFEACVRIMAAVMVLWPVQAVLSILYRVSWQLGGLVAMLVSLYGIWMIYLALVHCLKAKEKTAMIVCIVLAVLVALSHLGPVGMM